MDPRTRIVIPHRGLAASKTRLAAVLEPEARERLAGELLARVLRVSGETGHQVVVISPDADLAVPVQAAGARLDVQRGMGLNRGLEQARAAALADGIELLVVLHGDLPNLRADEVMALREAATGAGVAIAPDRNGTGTNGLALQPPDAIGFHFGPGSLAAHLADARAQAIEPMLVTRPGLAFDLDTPADLERWLRLGDAA